MAKHWSDQFSFSTGVLRSRGIGYLVLSADKMRKRKTPHSEFVVWNEGKWFDCGRSDWNTTSVTINRKPIEQLVALGEFGKVFFVGSGDSHEESVIASGIKSEERGPLRCVRLIGSRLYVVGMDRQAYRREGPDLWEAIDQGMRPPSDSEEVVGLEALDGFSEEEIYAAGWDGEMWLYNGVRWRQLHSPTNTIITQLCCCDEVVYACGRGGLLIEGRNDKWRVIEQNIIDDDIWGLCWYKESLYLSTLGAVYRMRNGDISVVEMGDDEPETCYQLCTADGIMWSIGDKDVMSFDGEKWSRID